MAQKPSKTGLSTLNCPQKAGCSYRPHKQAGLAWCLQSAPFCMHSVLSAGRSSSVAGCCPGLGSQSHRFQRPADLQGRNNHKLSGHSVESHTLESTQLPPRVGSTTAGSAKAMWRELFMTASNLSSVCSARDFSQPIPMDRKLNVAISATHGNEISELQRKALPSPHPPHTWISQKKDLLRAQGPQIKPNLAASTPIRQYATCKMYDTGPTKWGSHSIYVTILQGRIIILTWAQKPGWPGTKSYFFLKTCTC